MKMSEINETLVEAPEAYNAKQGFGKRLKTKLKKHTPFNAKARAQATKKDQIFKQAKKMKTQFAEYMANEPEGTEPSIKDLQQFFADTEFASYLMPVATKLKLVKPESVQTDIPKDKNSANAEETPKATSPAAADDADTLEKELEDPNTGDLPEEAGEDKEPKVDTSASIYEARLYNMLTELKDNEIDTLFVRMLQAQGKDKGGPVSSDSESEDGEAVAGNKSSSKSASSQMSLDDNEIEKLKDRLDEFENDLKNIIRNQSSIDDAAKKELTNSIHSLLVDMLDDSF